MRGHGSREPVVLKSRPLWVPGQDESGGTAVSNTREGGAGAERAWKSVLALPWGNPQTPCLAHLVSRYTLPSGGSHLDTLIHRAGQGVQTMGLGGTGTAEIPGPAPENTHTPRAARLTGLRTRRPRPGDQARRGPTALRGPAPAVSASSLGALNPEECSGAPSTGGGVTSCYKTQNHSRIRSPTPPPTWPQKGQQVAVGRLCFPFYRPKWNRGVLRTTHCSSSPGNRTREAATCASRGRALEKQAAEVRRPCGAAAQPCPAGSPLDTRSPFSAAPLLPGEDALRTLLENSISQERSLTQTV